MFVKCRVSSRIANDKASKSFVTDENVGAESEHEVRHVELARTKYSICQLVGGSGFEEEVGWPADAKGRVGREGLIAAQSRLCGIAARTANAGRNSLRDEIEPITKLLLITCAGRGG
jgi:hypothetical protein